MPAPNKAKEFLAAVPAGEEPLLDALERWLRSTTGVVVPREAWDWSKIAPHLQPTYRVVDDGGTEQARGKDLEALKAPLRPQFEQAMEEVASDAGLARSGETTWAFGTLDESATLTRAGHRVTVFPALVDEGATVGLGVFGSTDEAEARHRLGVRRLLLLALLAPVGRRAARPAVDARPAGAGRLAVRRTCRRCLWTAGPRLSVGWSMVVLRSDPRPTSQRWWRVRAPPPGPR